MLYIVDYMKALACLLIANFHSGMLFPDSLSLLSFGGDIGNNIFFMVSGFTLYPSIEKCKIIDGWRWYGRRLKRLLPILIFFYLASKIVRDQTIGNFMSFLNVYWFVGAILSFYIVLFIVVKIGSQMLQLGVCVCLLIMHFLRNGITAERYYIGFIAMLLGSILRRYFMAHKLENNADSIRLLEGTLLSCIIYCILKLLRARGYEFFGIIHVGIGIMTICIAALLISWGYINNEKLLSFSNKHEKIWQIVKWISSVTLSVYIIQGFNNYALMNYLVENVSFPFSYIICLVIVFMMAIFTTKLDGQFQRLLKKIWRQKS